MSGKPDAATGWTAKLKALSEGAANAAASLNAFRNHTQMSDDEAAFWLACRLADDRAGHTSGK